MNMNAPLFCYKVKLPCSFYQHTASFIIHDRILSLQHWRKPLHFTWVRLPI